MENQILLEPAKILGENLPNNLNRIQIEDLFSKYGPLNSSLIATKNNGFSITFKHLKDAQKALDALNNKPINIDGVSVTLSLRFSRYDKIKMGVLSGNQKAISLYSEISSNEAKTRNLLNYVSKSTKGLIQAQIEALPKPSDAKPATSSAPPSPESKPSKPPQPNTSKGITSNCIINLLTGDYKPEPAAVINRARLDEAELLVSQGFGGYKLLKTNMHCNYAIPTLPRLVDNKVVI